jgi:esterase FrsA
MRSFHWKKEFLMRNIKRLELIEFDDVHGSPHHMSEIQKYIPLSVLRQQQSRLHLAKVFLRTGLALEKFKSKWRNR